MSSSQDNCTTILYIDHYWSYILHYSTFFLGHWVIDSHCLPGSHANSRCRVKRMSAELVLEICKERSMWPAAPETLSFQSWGTWKFGTYGRAWRALTSYVFKIFQEQEYVNYLYYLVQYVQCWTCTLLIEILQACAVLLNISHCFVNLPQLVVLS